MTLIQPPGGARRHDAGRLARRGTRPPASRRARGLPRTRCAAGATAAAAAAASSPGSSALHSASFTASKSRDLRHADVPPLVAEQMRRRRRPRAKNCGIASATPTPPTRNFVHDELRRPASTRYQLLCHVGPALRTPLVGRTRWRRALAILLRPRAARRSTFPKVAAGSPVTSPVRALRHRRRGRDVEHRPSRAPRLVLERGSPATNPRAARAANPLAVRNIWSRTAAAQPEPARRRAASSATRASRSRTPSTSKSRLRGRPVLPRPPRPADGALPRRRACGCGLSSATSRVSRTAAARLHRPRDHRHAETRPRERGEAVGVRSEALNGVGQAHQPRGAPGGEGRQVRRQSVAAPLRLQDAEPLGPVRLPRQELEPRLASLRKSTSASRADEDRGGIWSRTEALGREEAARPARGLAFCRPLARRTNAPDGLESAAAERRHAAARWPVALAAPGGSTVAARDLGRRPPGPARPRRIALGDGRAFRRRRRGATPAAGSTCSRARWGAGRRGAGGWSPTARRRSIGCAAR